MLNFEEEYQDVLQNIEFAIVSIYRAHSNLLDYNVDEALDALIAHYKAQSQNRSPKLPRFTDERPEMVYEAMKEMCDIRLGNENFTTEDGEAVDIDATITHDEIIACLKRIKRSVKKWTKHGGRQGYLDFVQKYIL